MRGNIKNHLRITCEDVDLTTLSNIEFYVKQAGFFGCYTPTVVSATEMVVVIPLEDAKRLCPGNVKLQFAFTNAEGIPDASEIIAVKVSNLLKEVGYDPV